MRLSVDMLRGIRLGVIMLGLIMLNVIILSVVCPDKTWLAHFVSLSLSLSLSSLIRSLSPQSFICLASLTV